MSFKQLIGTLAAVIVIIFGVYFVLESPRKARDESGNTSKKSMMLYCGAGIRPAAEPVIAQFEKEHGIPIEPTYAGSGQLLGQISSHQRGDLYMPGAELYVDRAIEKGLAVEGSKRVVAYFVPVILVQKGNPKDIHSLEDLKKEGLRLGFGDERACAVGKKTLKILEKNNIALSELQENIQYESSTVNELGVAIQLGQVDAVIMWDANARNFQKHGDIIHIKRENNIISTIPIALLTSSKHPEEARDFIEFITSEAGREILRDRQYTVELKEK